MPDVQPMLDRFLDFICLLPPQELAQQWGLTQEIAALVCAGALALICFVVVLALVSAFMPKKKNAALGLAALATVPLLAWFAANYGELVIPSLYVVVFIALRALEGLVLGLALHRTKWFWIFPIGLGLAVGLVAHAGNLPLVLGPILMGLWFVVVAVLTGFSLSRRLAAKRMKALKSPLAWAALSLLFLAPAAFIPITAVDAGIYQFIFPVCFVAGLVYFRKKKAPLPPLQTELPGMGKR